jgi:hypothetical protein
VRWLAMKGPVLVEGAYQGRDVRSYTDIDVVVDRRAFGIVIDALLADGARLVDRNWTLIRSSMRGEVTLVLPHGSTLDLHWHLLNDVRVRHSFSVSMEELLDRRRLVAIGGHRIPTLDPADTVLTLAAHAGLAGGYRLVWMKDLERVVSAGGFRWADVVDRSHRYGLGLVVATMLERAVRVAGAAVPTEVLDALAPRRGWRGVIRFSDRQRPPERSFGHQLSGRTFVRSTRRSTATSTVELGRAMWSDVLKQVIVNPDHPWRPRPLRRARSEPAPEPAPNPLWLPGGDDDRVEFLRLLADEGADP